MNCIKEDEVLKCPNCSAIINEDRCEEVAYLDVQGDCKRRCKCECGEECCCKHSAPPYKLPRP